MFLRSYLGLIGVAFVLVLSGCVVSKYQETKTPELSGRVLEFPSRKPLTNATLEFVRGVGGAVVVAGTPKTVTDEAGRFKLPRSYISGKAVLSPLTGHIVDMGGKGSEDQTRLLRITCDGYKTKVVDTRMIYGTTEESRKDDAPSFFFMKGNLDVGDILLTKVQATDLP